MLNQLFFLLKTPQAAYGLEYVGIDRIDRRKDVSLNHLHHGQLQFQLALASGRNPRVLVYVGQLEPIFRTESYGRVMFVGTTVSRLSGLTSIMPLSKLWQSGGTKCGM